MRVVKRRSTPRGKELRCTTDSAPVNELRESIRREVRQRPEVEDPRALEKERTLLGKEGLDGREVDHRGIDFDLTEIRIHRRRERESRAESDAEIRAHRCGGMRGAMKRTVGEIAARSHA